MCSSCFVLLSGRFKQSWVRLPVLLVVIPVAPDQAAAKAEPLLLQAAAVLRVAGAAWSDHHAAALLACCLANLNRTESY